MSIFTVSLRDSPLSKAQGIEVLNALQKIHPEIELTFSPMKTYGDLDKKSSLRDHEKSDFFTREVHDAVLKGAADFAIHSAKDLEPILPCELEMIALTKGLPSEDALVLREGETLRDDMLIATSSERREEAVLQMGKRVRFRDLRGTIHERLELIQRGEADGVVIAEAALIRLHLTHLNRLLLPGQTAPLQGKLAIVARKERKDLKALFSPLDSRRRTLWTGLRPPEYVTHTPLIRPKLLKGAKEEVERLLPHATHLLITSQTTAEFLADLIPDYPSITYLSVGKKTANTLKNFGAQKIEIATVEEAEGLLPLLNQSKIGFLLYPRSSKGRSLLPQELKRREIPHRVIDLYETELLSNPYPLEEIDEIVFTSPTTVEAFIQLYGTLPSDKQLTAIGRITEEKLNQERQHVAKV